MSERRRDCQLELPSDEETQLYLQVRGILGPELFTDHMEVHLREYLLSLENYEWKKGTNVMDWTEDLRTLARYPLNIRRM